MKHYRTIFIAACLGVLALYASALAAIPVEVYVGKGTVLTLKEPSQRISLADPDLVDMTLITPSEILLTGKKGGNTTIIVWDKNDKRTFFDLIVIGNVEELKKRIAEVAPGSEVEVETVGESIMLKGTVKNKAQIAKIDTISKVFSGNVINFITVREAQQVLLNVRVAQIDRSKLKELGLSYIVKGIGGDNAELTAPGLVGFPQGDLGGPASTTTSITTDEGSVSYPGTHNVFPTIGGFDIDNLTPQLGITYFPGGISMALRALVSKDLAKILAEPNLLVRSGESGQFHVGTRVPIQTVTGTGGDASVGITYEEVGIRLNFSPEVLEGDVIRLKIDPAEVSSIARYLSFQNILAPEIDTRTVRTSVDLKEGESLVLAGLLSEEMKNNIQKLPILGDIPIFGALFRSTRKQLEQTELAFFITPSLVKPMAPGTEVELPGDNEPTDKELKEYDWIPTPWN